MEKTQKCVHEMMQALGLPLPNERAPGLRGLDFALLRALVREEAEEYDYWMVQLEKVVKRHSEWREYAEDAIACEFGDDVADHMAYLDDEAFRDEAALIMWSEVIDGICDTIVTLHNTTCAMGLDLEPFFDAVHRSNMDKVGGPVRDDGKALKPEGWEPPKLDRMLWDLVKNRNDWR